MQRLQAAAGERPHGAGAGPAWYDMIWYGMM